MKSTNIQPETYGFNDNHLINYYEPKCRIENVDNFEQFLQEFDLDYYTQPNNSERLTKQKNIDLYQMLINQTKLIYVINHLKAVSNQTYENIISDLLIDNQHQNFDPTVNIETTFNNIKKLNPNLVTPTQIQMDPNFEVINQNFNKIQYTDTFNSENGFNFDVENLKDDDDNTTEEDYDQQQSHELGDQLDDETKDDN